MLDMYVILYAIPAVSYSPLSIKKAAIPTRGVNKKKKYYIFLKADKSIN